MDDSRAQKNHLKDREAERMRRMAGSIGASQGMIGTHDSQDFLQVDRDDLWVDAEYYEFLIDEDLDALPNVKAITPQEVLRRFNDLERRATAIVRDWEAEDATLAKLISTAYPQPGPTDCRYSDFSTYLVAGSSEEERTEVLRCDMWANLQQAVVTDRSVEMRELLLEIKQHLSKQMGEIDAAQGVQGRRRALLSYLTRYEDGQDLQLAERVPASADTTWMILAKAEVMIEGWEAKDVATKRRFDEMVLNEEALEAM